MPITTTPSGGPQGEFSTYTPIYAQTLSAAVTSVTLSNIPSTFTDLVLIMQAKSTGTYGSLRVTVNSDSGTNYSHVALGGTGSAAGSSKASNQNWFDFCRTSGLSSDGFGIYTVNFMNYSNATTYKTVLDRTNVQFGTAGDGVEAIVGLWRSTAPINSITLATPGGATFGNFAIGSTFTLYGIKAAATQFIPINAAGGDYAVTDGTYAYHVFKSSGIFAPAKSLSCDVLVVAGGGGTASATGGGGAGGIVYATSQSLTATQYAVTVGGGGAGTTGATGNKGTNTTFSSLITANGGGAGTRTAGATTGSGGSGGGVATGNSPGTASAGSGGTGYANAGATGASGYGGGGGAGAAGGTNTGGNGLNTWSSWATATSTGVEGYYAGGGGGASNPTAGSNAGGLGGGGASGNSPSGATGGAGVPGVVSTGSGAGGGGVSTSDGPGATGGSGIVIVRYAV